MENDLKIYVEKQNIYIYTTAGIYELLIPENQFYDFLIVNSKKGFSTKDGIDLLEELGEIKLVG